MVDAINALSNAKAPAGVTTPPPADAAKLSANYTMFLKLLTAQLQYQDPLEPTDSSQYTEQLVNYSQVEQAIKTNDQLKELISINKTGGNQAAALLDYLGRFVEVDGDALALQNGKAQTSFTLDKLAKDVAIKIYDKNGVEVAELSGNNLSGKKTITWDGLDKYGRALPDGVYQAVVSATDADGKAVTVRDQRFMAQVNGIERTKDGTALSAMGLPIAEKNIRAVFTAMPASH